jgi:light-harvesting protein B-800-850 alpha chain
MIYGKIWLVVKPSVGIPLFLSAVAVSSFAVHLALLTNTTWLKAYYNGNYGKPATAADASGAAPPASPPPIATAAKK